jgi:hypothetical protein
MTAETIRIVSDDATGAHLRPSRDNPNGTAKAARNTDRMGRKIGAGEGIRTLDPDLGKVVLYP